MPKRSLSGLAIEPIRVVAPTKVNFGKSILIALADGPSPIIMSSLKSSIAEYKTSSTTLFSLCISSINKTSANCKLVRIAAKSPHFAKTGPEVLLKPTPISVATICAKVVLPSPGGP